jgi:hypothetical protein
VIAPRLPHAAVASDQHRLGPTHGEDSAQDVRSDVAWHSSGRLPSAARRMVASAHGFGGETEDYGDHQTDRWTSQEKWRHSFT